MAHLFVGHSCCVWPLSKSSERSPVLGHHQTKESSSCCSKKPAGEGLPAVINRSLIVLRAAQELTSLADYLLLILITNNAWQLLSPDELDHRWFSRGIVAVALSILKLSHVSAKAHLLKNKRRSLSTASNFKFWKFTANGFEFELKGLMRSLNILLWFDYLLRASFCLIGFVTKLFSIF